MKGAEERCRKERRPHSLHLVEVDTLLNVSDRSGPRYDRNVYDGIFRAETLENMRLAKLATEFMQLVGAIGLSTYKNFDVALQFDWRKIECVAGHKRSIYFPRQISGKSR